VEWRTARLGADADDWGWRAVGWRAEGGMNVPILDRSTLLKHIRAVEQDHPLKIVALLPRGAAPHVEGDDAVDFLAEKREGLSLLGLTSAELDLAARLGRPVGIVLASELSGAEKARVERSARPL
jgi:hypothetical protein